MENENIKKILHKFKNDKYSLEETVKNIKEVYYTGAIKIDFDREARCGFPEVIFGEYKDTDQILSSIEQVLNNNKKRVLITRLSEEKYRIIKREYPSAFYDNKAKVFIIDMLKDHKYQRQYNNNTVAIVTAGTSDIPVALEAKYMLEFSGCATKNFFDVGVAGIHRLFNIISEIKKSKVVICVAGMEGALPSVLGGLIDIPLIAIPTSIGYGTSFGGFSSLITMLNSCANGITVVNIDNGFGGACAALRIINAINKQNNYGEE